jgi:hypothetical protein
VTTVAHNIDGGGSIAMGTHVNSHMIFLNSLGTAALSYANVVWTFDGIILVVMSNGNGSFEVNSSFELGNSGTNYPMAPFNARGLEGNDSYVVAGNQITVNMLVTEPGDWIRVVTAVSEPGTLLFSNWASSRSAPAAGIRQERRRRAIHLRRSSQLGSYRQQVGQLVGKRLLGRGPH